MLTRPFPTPLADWPKRNRDSAEARTDAPPHRLVATPSAKAYCRLWNLLNEGSSASSKPSTPSTPSPGPATSCAACRTPSQWRHTATSFLSWPSSSSSSTPNSSTAPKHWPWPSSTTSLKHNSWISPCPPRTAISARRRTVQNRPSPNPSSMDSTPSSPSTTRKSPRRRHPRPN